MLNDVDQSLRSLMQEALPANGTPPQVSFEPPTAEWASGQKDPVVNLFLFDVREDLEGQGSDEYDVRDDDGTLIGRQPPTRRYRLAYLVSAWSTDAEAEHELLGALLASVPNEAGIPTRHLVGRLEEQGLPVRINVGLPLPGSNTWDLWGALGASPRTAIEVVVTAPLVPELRTELAPPAVELELGMNKSNPGEVAPPSPVSEETRDREPEPEPELDAKRRGRRKTEAKRQDETGEATQAKEATEHEAPELEARPGKRWATFRVRETSPVRTGD